MSEVIDIQEGKNFDLNCYKNIYNHHGYKLLKLEENYAKVVLHTHQTETVDDNNHLYDSAIFSAANFSAMASVNEKDIFLIGANVDFLNRVKKEDETIIFEATTTNNISGKKHINVIGTVNGIKVFNGEFIAIKLDNDSNIMKKNKPKE